MYRLREDVSIHSKNLSKLIQKNILFYCRGAFDGIETIVKERLGDKTIGFGTDSREAEEVTDKNILQHVIPEDLLKFGLIPEFIGRLPVMTALEKT